MSSEIEEKKNDLHLWTAFYVSRTMTDWIPGAYKCFDKAKYMHRNL
jgi:hypothetical protein